jgi:hypothetical protein
VLPSQLTDLIPREITHANNPFEVSQSQTEEAPKPLFKFHAAAPTEKAVS